MTGTTSIPNYPPENRVPGFYFSLDNSQANTAMLQRRVLLIGQMTDKGIATPGRAEQISGTTSANSRFGIGSQLALMINAYRKIDGFGELWALPLADGSNITKATGTITLAGTPTESGNLYLYIDDVLIQQVIVEGDTLNNITKSLVNKINSATTIPVQATAGQTAGTITITALNAGKCGNDISLGINLLGSYSGQITPNGLKVTLQGLAGGNGSPIEGFSAALDNLGSRKFDIFVHPYAEPSTLSAMTSFLDDATGRWKMTEQLFGHSITAFKGTYGEATALGSSQNDQHSTIMATSNSPTHPMIWAAQIGAQVLLSMVDNPAMPITGLTLNVMPPTDNGIFAFDERNSLLYDGISTFKVQNNDQVTIERLITTYRHNSNGMEDDSYLNIEIMLTAAVAIQDMRDYLATQFYRCILVNDISKLNAGQRVTTAQLIAKTCVSRYRTQEQNLWVQDSEGFSKAIIAKNEGNGRVSLLMPYRFSDQLFFITANCQFVKLKN